MRQLYVHTHDDTGETCYHIHKHHHKEASLAFCLEWCHLVFTSPHACLLDTRETKTHGRCLVWCDPNKDEEEESRKKRDGDLGFSQTGERYATEMNDRVTCIPHCTYSTIRSACRAASFISILKSQEKIFEA